MDFFLVVFILAVLLITILTGHPIAFGLGGVAIWLGMFLWGPIPDFLPLFNSRMLTLMNNLPMIAIPLFLFMGTTLDASGVTTKLFSNLEVWVDRLPGGLGVGALIISILLAASTGIVTASLTLLALLALPQMLNRGYNKQLAGGIVMAGGCLGVIIPPSLMLIIYGSVLSESVGRLFAGSLLPGILLGVLYIAYVLVRCRLQPELAPVKHQEGQSDKTRKRLNSLPHIIPPLFLITAVLGTIIAGIATPTEAAGIGALGAIILALCYKGLSWEIIKIICHSTAKTTAMVMWLLFGGICFQTVFYGLGGGVAVSSFFMGLEISSWIVLTLVLFTLFILGMFLDWITILLIFMPAFVSIITALGMDSLWFAIVFCIIMQTSFLTPPIGGALFFVKAVAPKEVSYMDLVRSVPPLIAIQVFVLILVLAFPSLATWLPSLMVR